MNAFHSYIRLGWSKIFMAKICTYYVAWMSTNIHLTSAWIVSFFVSFIYSEIVSQIVSTLFVEQLHLLAIVCLAMKGNDATTGMKLVFTWISLFESSLLLSRSSSRSISFEKVKFYCMAVKTEKRLCEGLTKTSESFDTTEQVCRWCRRLQTYCALGKRAENTLKSK